MSAIPRWRPIPASSSLSHWSPAVAATLQKITDSDQSPWTLDSNHRRALEAVYSATEGQSPYNELLDALDKHLSIQVFLDW
ncbi:hypothetical protein BMS3Bbin02_00011 [bacterium BMS3Bbin02]|nr:hypothetical protein BMS3Bbin02_00011 [bacterium BMS3Bbin02]